jgi:hypothetical protein
MTTPGTTPSPSDKEKEIEIERQMAEFVKLGYKREHLWVTADGRVGVDPDAMDLEVYMKVFHPNKKIDD